MVRHSREADLGWLAGFFEGEGSINISQRRHRVGTVTLTQQNELLVERLVKLLHELNIPKPGVQQPVAKMCCYNIFWNGPKGSLFLQAIRPYFRHPHRMARADIYLRYFDPIRTGERGRIEERELLFKEFERQRQLERAERNMLRRRFE